MTSELVALMGDDRVGRVLRDARGRLRFVYDERWRTGDGSYPLSLSMPLAVAEHGHSVVDAYLWGLLPDNEIIVERWAQRFHVSPRNPFALLAHVGEDCAGAVRFATSERVREVTRQGYGTVDWLDEREIADRLRALRRDISAWWRAADGGQFSLAGAQAKTALFFDGKRWGVPSGRVPTTHILKPGAPDLVDHTANEHFCLALAQRLGLPAATSRIMRFEDEIAIVVERYDRIAVGRRIVRVHQEDVCQALGVHPARKYESDGGPGARDIVRLLREHSGRVDEDLDTFLRALVLHWLVGGTDAHAKNYSVLIGAEGRARLAPLYDVASALPYAGKQSRKLKLAMKIGGKYRLQEIGRYQWQKAAADLSLAEGQVLEVVREMATRTPDAAAETARQIGREGIASESITKLGAIVSDRARRLTAP
jgi:serine/threonine-protein kinase HipA